MPLLQPSTSSSPDPASIKKQTALKLGVPVVEKLTDNPCEYFCQTCEQKHQVPHLLTISLKRECLQDPNFLDKYLDTASIVSQLDFLYDHHEYVILWDNHTLTCPKCWEIFVEHIKKEISQ